MRVLPVWIGVAVVAILAPAVSANLLSNGGFDAYGGKPPDEQPLDDWDSWWEVVGGDPTFPPSGGKYNGTTHTQHLPFAGNCGSTDHWADPGFAVEVRIHQSVYVPAGQVALTGVMSAGSNMIPSDFQHVIELLDVEAGTSDVFTMSGIPDGSEWTPFTLTLVHPDPGEIQVRWGFSGTNTSQPMWEDPYPIVTTHVDALVLTPEPGTLASLLALGGLLLIRRRR